eukprot:11449033-Alexandrium_andersonii.AAC.1
MKFIGDQLGSPVLFGARLVHTVCRGAWAEALLFCEEPRLQSWRKCHFRLRCVACPRDRAGAGLLLGRVAPRRFSFSALRENP